MKIMLKDLVNIADKRIYHVSIKNIEIKDNIFITGISEIEGEISFYYDYDNKLKIEIDLLGTMHCPDSFTLEDVEVPFEINDDQFVVTNQFEDGFYLIDCIELEELIKYIVIPEAPISVEKNKETIYHSEDGCSVFREEEYEKFTKNRIDPRLEKLLEFKEED